jgi:tRNA (guanine37-N1)-methyltransferase
MEVPKVLRSGDHQKVKEWRFEQSLERTKQVRPDIYKKFRNEQ